jgi:hypothetical protein
MDLSLIALALAATFVGSLGFLTLLPRLETRRERSAIRRRIAAVARGGSEAA